ncbi:hypothetical protein SK803_40310 [Lentzea sp. BCCO 10_0856]|uniref:PEP-CTERM protein-sorting domain-containing protein n=1 Tax=Lentzea miocenica TaxID=3095431 RepID=A0ABU4TE83_9PSEU|nr:hypothetical protein [Lentzea sp. BCCO 10_0856]MDX8036476.1 hypothetical protein [Lentzea sp. BCCO 10_0856]
MTAVKLMPLAVGVFAVGVLAIIVVFVLFATGHSDLPVWLNVIATYAPAIGLALGIIAVVRKARRKKS